MKKRIVSFLLILTLLFTTSLIGCDTTDKNADPADETNNTVPADNNGDTTSNGAMDNNASTEDKPAATDDGDGVSDNDDDTVSEEADDGLMKREDIPDQYKWDLSKIYEDTDAYMKDVATVQQSFESFQNAQETFTTSYEHFHDTLTLYQKMRRTTDKVYVFASLQAHTDTRNNDFSDLEDIAAKLDTDLSEATAYFMPSIAALDEDILSSYMNHAYMKDYIPYINDILKDKSHILSTDEEEILAQAQIMFEIPESIYDAYNYLTDLSEYLPEPDWNGFWNGTRDQKREALEAYYAKSAAGINLLSEIYESEIKKNTFFAEARHYDSALESALDVDGMTLEAYDKLFEITHDNVDKLHRWISLKKEILNIDDQVHLYDLYTPLIDDPYEWTEYEPGKEIVYAALAPLGDKYIDDLKEGFESRWADVYPTSGKYEGGYQWGTYDTSPFVLLNFYGMMTDVSTMAHEMGHAINFKYSNEAQGYFAAGVPIFNAEIASTTNESMVFEYRIKNASSKAEKQRALLNYIELIENTIFTQMIYADFEKRAYEAYEAGEPISADLFNAIMQDVYTEYYGPDFKADEMASYQWAEIPHFYNPYYVYKYATGLSAGLSFADQVINGSEEDVQKYLAFLAAGSSEPPLELLKNAGVDFSTGEPIQNAFDKFDALVDAFEETLQ